MGRHRTFLHQYRRRVSTIHFYQMAYIFHCLRRSALKNWSIGQRILWHYPNWISERLVRCLNHRQTVKSSLQLDDVRASVPNRRRVPRTTKYLLIIQGWSVFRWVGLCHIWALVGTAEQWEALESVVGKGIRRRGTTSGSLDWNLIKAAKSLGRSRGSNQSRAPHSLWQNTGHAVVLGRVGEDRLEIAVWYNKV